MKNQQPIKINPDQADLMPGLYQTVFFVFKIPGILLGQSEAILQPVPVLMNRNTGFILREGTPIELHKTIDEHNKNLNEQYNPN
jgi:hypothetical protein